MTATATLPKLTRMDALGYINPKVTGSRKNVQFKITVREHKKYNRDLATFIQLIDEILVPRLNDSGTDWARIGDTDEIDYIESEICYIPGQPTIFVDEIMERNGWDRATLEKKIGRLKVIDEMIIVPSTDVSLIFYLRACNYNSDRLNRNTRKPVRFHEYSKEAEAEKFTEKTLQNLNIQFKVKELIDNNERSKMAAMVSILTNKSMDQIEKMYLTPDLKTYLLSKVMSDPMSVERLFTDPNVVKRMTIVDAIAKGLILQTDREFILGNDIIHVKMRGEDSIQALTNKLSADVMRLIEAKLTPIQKKAREEEMTKDQLIEAQQRKIEELQAGQKMSAQTEKDDTPTPSSLPYVENPTEFFQGLIDNGVIDKPNVSLPWLKHENFPGVSPIDGKDRKGYRLEELVQLYQELPDSLTAFFATEEVKEYLSGIQGSE